MGVSLVIRGAFYFGKRNFRFPKMDKRQHDKTTLEEMFVKLHARLGGIYQYIVDKIKDSKINVEFSR